MLPNLFPAFPKRSEFALYATMDPAKEVGGDFYDFFLIDTDHLAMVVADVSGKGVPAALFMMTARTILKTKAQSSASLSPKELLMDANAALTENNKEGMFVTVWLGILEISTGTLTYADAGHEKLLLYQDGAWRFLPKTTCGPALAMWEPDDFELVDDKYRYCNETIRLSPGDAIFQYTDGVTEAMNAGEELFGDERLLEAVNSAPSAKPEELLPHVRGKIDEFVKEAPQFDDITLLALRYSGVGKAGKAPDNAL
jgi:sigma-B regulation protein RsbU (phosphoserine phosphatase)